MQVPTAPVGCVVLLLCELCALGCGERGRLCRCEVQEYAAGYDGYPDRLLDNGSEVGLDEAVKQMLPDLVPDLQACFMADLHAILQARVFVVQILAVSTLSQPRRYRPLHDMCKPFASSLILFSHSRCMHASSCDQAGTGRAVAVGTCHRRVGYGIGVSHRRFLCGR